jgi:transglutaminase-like putative cysteine protease
MIVGAVNIENVNIILMRGGQEGGGGENQPSSEYVVKEYPLKNVLGPEPLVYGEISYTIKFEYHVSNYSPPFRVRLWENREGLTYNTETVTTIDNYEYAEWNFGTGEAYLSKSGVQRARLYEDSGGPFVGENFGWFGSRWCQGRLYINTENEVIKNTAEDIRRKSGSPYEVAKNVAIWMAERLTFQGPETRGYVHQKRTPVEVLENSGGDCFELSMLYISICRAAGVPARGVWVTGFPENLNTPDGMHVRAEFYDGKKWVPVDITYLIELHAGRGQFVLGPVSDWFGFDPVDWGTVTLYVEDQSENFLERLYSDTFEFEDALYPPNPTLTRSGSASVQKTVTLRIYNTGRRELVFQ